MKTLLALACTLMMIPCVALATGGEEGLLPVAGLPAADAGCEAELSLDEMSSRELEAWAEEAGLELSMPPPTATATPICPPIQSCPSGCTEGPACFIGPPIGPSCCFPGGPCLTCPPGKQVHQTGCRCTGSGCTGSSSHLTCL